MDIQKEFEKWWGENKKSYLQWADEVNAKQTGKKAFQAGAELMSDELSKSNTRIVELEAVVSSQANEIEKLKENIIKLGARIVEGNFKTSDLQQRLDKAVEILKDGEHKAPTCRVIKALEVLEANPLNTSQVGTTTSANSVKSCVSCIHDNDSDSEQLLPICEACVNDWVIEYVNWKPIPSQVESKDQLLTTNESSSKVVEKSCDNCATDPCSKPQDRRCKECSYSRERNISMDGDTFYKDNWTASIESKEVEK